MDTSYELLSSMSPKVNKHVHKPKKGKTLKLYFLSHFLFVQTPGPTMLALKRYFRRSSMIPTKKKPNPDETIIVITSGSDYESDCTSTSGKQSPIVISDSENSATSKSTQDKRYQSKTKITLKTNKSETGLNEVVCDNNFIKIDARKSQEDRINLSETKKANIQCWLEEVNKEKSRISFFSEVSTIYPGSQNSGFVAAQENIAVNSTFQDILIPNRRFDEYFKRTCYQDDKSLDSSDIKSKKKNSSPDKKAQVDSKKDSSTSIESSQGIFKNKKVIEDSLLDHQKSDSSESQLKKNNQRMDSRNSNKQDKKIISTTSESCKTTKSKEIDLNFNVSKSKGVIDDSLLNSQKFYSNSPKSSIETDKRPEVSSNDNFETPKTNRLIIEDSLLNITQGLNIPKNGLLKKQSNCNTEDNKSQGKFLLN